MKPINRILILTAASICHRRYRSRLSDKAGRDLVQKSEPLVDVSAWLGLNYPNDGRFCPPYRWITETSVFTFSSLEPPRNLILVDLEHNNKRELNSLEQHTTYIDHVEVQAFDVSPDRTHIIWSVGANTLQTAALDGGDLRTWTVPAQGLIDVQCGCAVVTSGWRNTTLSQGEFLPFVRCLGDSIGPHSSVRWISQEESDSIEVANPVEDANDDKHERNEPSFRIMLGGRKGKKSIIPPNGMQICEVVASPDCRHLALLLEGARHLPYSNLIHRFYANYLVNPEAVPIPLHQRSGWFTRARGWARGCVGRVPRLRNAPEGCNGRPLEPG